MKEIFVITYKGKPLSIGFNTILEAFEWLQTERGATQIEGWRFTKGFRIRPINIK